MVVEERYFWVCTFTLHDESRIWWAYFKDRQEVDDFFARIIEILPCIIITRLQECVDGLTAGKAYYHHCMSSQIRANEKCRRAKIRLTYLGQPAPISRDFLPSFFIDLRKFPVCFQCAPSLPLIEELMEFARHHRHGAKYIPREQTAVAIPGSEGLTTP